MRNYKISIDEYNKLLAHVDKTIKHDAELIKIYERLIEGLKGYVGKVLNTRIEKVAQDILSEYRASYSKRYDHYYLYITKGNERFEISLIGYNQEKNCRFNLDYLNNNLKIIKLRNEQDKLKVDEIMSIVMTYNNALDWFRRAEEKLRDIPGWYNFNRF